MLSLLMPGAPRWRRAVYFDMFRSCVLLDSVDIEWSNLIRLSVGAKALECPSCARKKFGQNSDRRMMPQLSDVLEFGPWRIDREQRLLTKEDNVIPLAPKVFDTLLVLVESGGRMLEKETLLKKVWPETFVEEGSLARNISRLRK